MSESEDGVSVAITRQNSGRLLKGARLTGNPPGGAAGGVKVPAATLCAELMVTCGRLSLERLSQADPPVGAANREPAGIISEIMNNLGIESFIIENFIIGHTPQPFVFGN